MRHELCSRQDVERKIRKKREYEEIVYKYFKY